MSCLSESSENIKTIDKKGRFAIPMRVRRLLSDNTLTVIKGFNGSLFGYDTPKWEKIRERLEKPSFNPEHIRLTRTIGATMEEVEIDKQGRILLSKGLMEDAGLKPGGSVVIIPALNRIEIWSLERFKDQMIEMTDEGYEHTLQSLFE
jgi:division/cell wall cluster transcriptional repressor MraZ